MDGLRFIAIFSVILFHMLNEMTGRIGPVEPGYRWLEQPLSNGFRGVTLFFVISGMILALPFARQYLLGSKPVSLRKYYLRRVTRLEPPYLASLLLIVLMIVICRHGIPEGLLPHAWATAFYQHSLIYGQWSSISGVTWSLEVEIQFYILAPFAMQIYRLRHTALRRSLLLACILILGLAQIPFFTWPRVRLSILFYVQYFLTGILVADIFVLHLNKMKSSWIWDAVGIAALGVVFWMTHDGVWAHILMPFAFFFLFIAVMTSFGLRRVLANQWIAVIGGMCYSIYLLHYTLILAMFKITRKIFIPGALFFVNYWIQFLVVVVPVVAMCAIFFVLVERPCMDPNWPSKIWHKLTGRRAIEAEALNARGS